MKVTDSYNLVLEGNLLLVHMPALEKVLVFRILDRENKGNEVINYGPLPISSGDTLNYLETGTTTAPADGVIVGLTYTPEAYLLSSLVSPVVDSNDMFYLSEDQRDILFHLHLYITPDILRVLTEYPKGKPQQYFQKGKVTLYIHSDFGWRRGYQETIRIPKVYVGYRFCNDTNLDFYTFLKIVYAEYRVEIPKDPELIWNAIMGKVPAYRHVLPYVSREPTLPTALRDVYGIEGFPIIWEKEKALEEYRRLLEEVKL